MIIGFHVSSKQNAFSAARCWPDKNVACGVLLTVQGTIPDPDAPTLDGIENAFQTSASYITRTLDNIASGSGFTDLVYAATQLVECCRSCHEYIRDLGLFNGQGIYLSGVISYFTQTHYLMLPFGSGCAYTLGSEQLIHQCGMGQGLLVPNTIGGAEEWLHKCWQAERTEGMRLILTSQALPDLQSADTIIRNHSSTTDHANTVSLLLDQLLESVANGLPTAVLDLRFAPQSQDETAY